MALLFRAKREFFLRSFRVSFGLRGGELRGGSEGWEKTWKKNVHFFILRRLGKRLRILQSFSVSFFSRSKIKLKLIPSGYG
jgi:hypothetical protein